MLKPLFLTLCIFCLLTNAGLAKKPLVTPVTTLALPAYAGVWYEVARTPNIFQNRCASDTVARYTLQPNGQIDVKNSCKDPKGQLKQVIGSAWQPDPKQPGKLKVSFAQWLGRNWFAGNYWVLGVDTSRYAVIGEPRRHYGWVLSRTPQLTPQDQQQALAILTKQGYNLCRFLQDPPAVSRREVGAFCSGH